MALGEFDFPTDFLKEFLETDPESICKEALKEAAPIYEDALKKSMEDVIEHAGDSEMVESVKSSKVKKCKDGDGWYINITPTGYSKQKYYYGTDKRGGHYNRKYQVSNALKAIWKEYGIPGHQKPAPFILNARFRAEKDIFDKIQEVYNRRIGSHD